MIDTLIIWCGFAGAWLLVAGPLYQGVLELREEESDQADADPALRQIAPPPPPSSWWWFLPPVMLIFRRRRRREYDRTVLASLTPRQRLHRERFIHKATGWFVVALGGAFIAIKETWEVAEHLEWPLFVFVIVVLAMFALVGGNTFRQGTRRTDTTDEARTADDQ